MLLLSCGNNAAAWSQSEHFRIDEIKRYLHLTDEETERLNYLFEATLLNDGTWADWIYDPNSDTFITFSKNVLSFQ